METSDFFEGRQRQEGEPMTPLAQRNPDLCTACEAPPDARCLQAEINEAALCSLILDLHDGLVQNLFAAFSQVHSLRQAIAREGAGTETSSLDRHLRRIGELIEASLQEIRSFVGAFGPEELGEQDLGAMVEGLAMQREDLSGIPIQVEVAEDLPPVSLPVKIALYRILQEALSNAYRHAQARHQWVRLFQANGSLHLEVTDDGQGFNPEEVLGPGPTKGSHLGLRGMRDRVRMLGGEFGVESRPGQGTTIRVRIPL